MARKKTRKQKRVKENIVEYEVNRVLLLNIHKFLIILIFWLLSVILHNIISGRAEEPFFFIIAVILLPLYLLVSLIYTIFHFIGRK